MNDQGSSWDDPAVVEWARLMADQFMPGMERSHIAVAWGVGDDDKIHPTAALQLGAMILLDKPILVIALAGQHVPPKLALVADEVVHLPSGVDPDGSREVETAMRRMMRRLEARP